MKISKLQIGYLELLLAQLCLSINVIFGKIIAPFYPLTCLLLMRFLLGFIIIAFYLVGTRSIQVCAELQQLRKNEWIILIMQILCGGFLFNILTLYGLQYTTATVTGILQSTFPMVVTLFSCIILKEKLTERKILAIILTVLGIFLMSIKDFHGLAGNNLYGIFFIALAIIPGSLYTVFSKMLNIALKPITAVMLMNLLNTLLFLPLALNESWEAFRVAAYPEWIKIFIYAVTGSVLFFIFWYRGVARLAVSTASLFIGVMPISTSILAYFLLQESLSLFGMLGILFVVIAIFVGTANIAWGKAK